LTKEDPITIVHKKKLNSEEFSSINVKICSKNVNLKIILIFIVEIDVK
jgi:hypothetical protein